MKIKLDENLPADLAPGLVRLGHDVHTPHDEGLSGAEDSDIWQAAQNEERFLITQDLDFSDVRRFTPGSHHGLLLIRLPDSSRRALIDRVIVLFRQQAVTEWSGCFIVASDRKVRVRRPATTA
jgi:predicted nuclease of predicted toxin-antitoxin system